MIQIFTDTSANLPAAYIQKYSLRVIPLTYFVDGVEAHQDPAVDFDGKAYYDAMRSGTPVSTAMINLGAFLEPLHAALAAGDDVIYIGMSGGISGTANAHNPPVMLPEVRSLFFCILYSFMFDHNKISPDRSRIITSLL